jgi:hypothetical protein
VKPYVHSLSSVKKWGGKPEDYLPIHDFMDSSKACLPDVRHRAILHNSFGCFLAERVFGHNITNSDGKLVSVRDVAEQHVIEDLGTIPTVEQWLKEVTIQDWMGPPKKKVKKYTLGELLEGIPEKPEEEKVYLEANTDGVPIPSDVLQPPGWKTPPGWSAPKDVFFDGNFAGGTPPLTGKMG